MLIRILREYLRPYYGQLALVLVLQLIANTAALYLPTLNARIVDDGIATGNTVLIVQLGAVMLGITVVQMAGQLGAVWFGARSAMAFGRDLRGAIFGRTLDFSAREVTKFGAPSLITRNTNDVQQIQQLVMMTSFMIIAAPIMMVGGVIMAYREDPGLTWTIAVAVIILATLIGLVVSQMMPLFALQQKRIDTINRVLREQISGLRVIRAFTAEPRETQRFAIANAELTDTATKVGRRMMTLFPMVFFVMNVSTIAVTWFGAFRVAEGAMQTGQLLAFIQYLTTILMSVLMATMMLMIAPRAVVSAGRIAAVLDTESTVVPPAQAVRAVTQNGHVQLQNVEFRYPGAEQPVLCAINLEVKPGQTTAIIGSTGAGKSTLVSLIPRLFDATGGRVLVDGVDVRDLDPDLLWSRIGLVPQKPYLFTGTVGSNLRYGKPDATDDEIWAALRTAQAADFVRAMPGQLDAPITQGGTNVSGGQRQRLSIARALVKKPDIYIFDDSFSALDVTTDARLRMALKRETHQAGVLIVAQRVSTIRDAETIVVLDDGRIEGVGSHDDLLATCPTYAEIVESQFKAEEAAA
ncbi:MAG TPA: ABC transporter ATP-binding protein [Micropruina sp.]|jgi:ATP-binding cassette subfamily B protein|nr:ABC transporter ATP-binding protein [Micropruina sp.]